MKFLFWIIILVHILVADAITPIPASLPYDQSKALLGKVLFYDTQLSSDGTVGCISCHDLSTGGADSRKVSIGAGGGKGNIQSPSVFNAVFNYRQFWNARAKDLREQIKGPLYNPVEHNLNVKTLEIKVNSNSYYKEQFTSIYGKQADEASIIDVLVEFEKTLITPDSKFDKFLRKEITLSRDEMNGYRLFKTLGCISCHNGVNIGGNSLQIFGVGNKYPWNKNIADRFSLTKNENEKNLFKVPTLRNIELTAPYLHDGSVATLKAAIKKIAYYNLGLNIEDKEAEQIEIFLKTLTGKKPKILE